MSDLSRGRACVGKRRYPTYDAAKARAIGLRRHSKRGRFVRAYACPYCEGWHVGTAPLALVTPADANDPAPSPPVPTDAEPAPDEVPASLVPDAASLCLYDFYRDAGDDDLTALAHVVEAWTTALTRDEGDA